MAYFDQERKQQLAPKINEILKRYKVKGSLSVRNHMVFVLKIKSGSIDFIQNFTRICGDNPFAEQNGHVDVNPYHYQKHFDGVALEFLDEVIKAMNIGNYDRSDVMTDYFDVGWYTDIKIGDWDSPYILTDK